MWLWDFLCDIFRIAKLGMIYLPFVAWLLCAVFFLIASFFATFSAAFVAYIMFLYHMLRKSIGFLGRIFPFLASPMSQSILMAVFWGMLAFLIFDLMYAA